LGLEPGKKGREKRMRGERERATRREREVDEDEDEDNWFERRRREGREGEHRRRDGRERGSEKRPSKSLMMRMQLPEEVSKPSREPARRRNRAEQEGRHRPQYSGGYGR
jgi:hypothetical protein